MDRLAVVRGGHDRHQPVAELRTDRVDRDGCLDRLGARPHEQEPVRNTGGGDQAAGRVADRDISEVDRFLETRPDHSHERRGPGSHRSPAQCNARLGSSLYRRLSSSWTVSRIVITARLASETVCSSTASEWIASASASSSSVVGSEIPESDASCSTRRRASNISSSGTPIRTASPREVMTWSSALRMVVSRSTRAVRSPPSPRPSSSAWRISARPWSNRRSNDRYSRSAMHSSRRSRRSSSERSPSPSTNDGSRTRSMRRFAGWSSTSAMLHLGLITHSRDQDVRHFGTRELDRRPLTRAEHLAHLRPREDHAVVVLVRAGLGRAHPLTSNAEERVLEHQWGDPELTGLELLEDLLRVIGAVISADP